MNDHLLLILFVLFQVSFAQNSNSELHIKPNELILENWLSYYNLSLSYFKLESSTKYCINCSPNKESNYFREFHQQDDNDTLLAVNYSPNKRKYVSLGVEFMLKQQGNITCFLGWDHGQEIYLTDIDLKHNNLVLWLGSIALAEDVFWNKNEDIFYIVGFETYQNDNFFIYEFNLEENVIAKYETEKNQKKTKISLF